MIPMKKRFLIMALIVCVSGAFVSCKKKEKPEENTKETTNITVKEKEFVTLGIAIAVRCEGCIEAHVRNLVNLKATREEIAEVISVAVVMGGGPSTVYGAKALEAFDQLSK